MRCPKCDKPMERTGGPYHTAPANASIYGCNPDHPYYSYRCPECKIIRTKEEV